MREKERERERERERETAVAGRVTSAWLSVICDNHNLVVNHVPIKTNSDINPLL